MVYKQVNLNITPAQMRKAAAGKQITLAANQLSGGSMTTYLHPANVEKLMKAKKAGRGARIYIAPGAINHDLDQMHGASIWSWLKEKAFPWVKKTLWPALKPVLSPLVDQGATMLGSYTGQPALVGAVRGVVKSELGVGFKGSQSAKDRMAKVRSMRKKGGSMKAGSFKL
jgi:hypothetical protein